MCYDVSVPGITVGLPGLRVVLRLRFHPQALPELTPELLEERRRHNVLLFQALQEAATTEENVARRPVPWRK